MSNFIASYVFVNSDPRRPPSLSMATASSQPCLPVKLRTNPVLP